MLESQSKLRRLNQPNLGCDLMMNTLVFNNRLPFYMLCKVLSRRNKRQSSQRLAKLKLHSVENDMK